MILATGVSWRQLPIEGLERLLGKGVHYGAARSDAPGTHGLDVHVVGAGNSAGPGGPRLREPCAPRDDPLPRRRLEKSMSAYLIEQLRTKSNIGVVLGARSPASKATRPSTAVEIRNSRTGEAQRVESGGLYIFIGADAETEWLPEEIALDGRGYVLTGGDVQAAGRWEHERDPYLLETSVPGIFACGDVRFGPVKRVAAAVGEGSMAIAFVHQYLKGG